MKKWFLYFFVGIFLLGLLWYFLGEIGLLSGLGLVGFAGGRESLKFKKKAENLEKKAEQIEKDLSEIEKEQTKLKEDGVVDLTPNEEVQYWSNQD